MESYVAVARNCLLRNIVPSASLVHCLITRPGGVDDTAAHVGNVEAYYDTAAAAANRCTLHCGAAAVSSWAHIALLDCSRSGSDSRVPWITVSSYTPRGLKR